MKICFSNETFCFKFCSEPSFGQIPTPHDKVVAMRPKVFGSTSENGKMNSRKTFLQRLPLVTSRAVSITSPRFSRNTAKNLCSRSKKSGKKRKVILNFFIYRKTSLRGRQFCQPCWNDSSKRLKQFCSLCAHDQKTSSEKMPFFLKTFL